MSNWIDSILYRIARWSVNLVVRRKPYLLVPIMSGLVEYARTRLPVLDYEELEQAWEKVKGRNVNDNMETDKERQREHDLRVRFQGEASSYRSLLADCLPYVEAYMEADPVGYCDDNCSVLRAECIVRNIRYVIDAAQKEAASESGQGSLSAIEGGAQ